MENAQVATVTSEIRDLYNRQATHFVEPWAVIPARRYFMERKIRTALRLGSFKKGDHILDVGCNIGQYSFLLRERGLRVTGVDLSEGAIEQARVHARSIGADDITFEVADVQKMSQFDEGQFDGAVSFSTFRYIPDIESALRHVRHVLKPGGAVVIDLPNKYCPWFWGLRELFGYSHIHDNHYSAKESAKLFRKCGFRYVAVKTILLTPPYVPEPVLPLFKAADSLIEPLPGVHNMAGIHIVRGVR